MEEELNDHSGVIKMIDIQKGFGFIYSDLDQKNYYFKLNSLHEIVKPNDIVAFVVKTNNRGVYADAIRKVYTNKSGIKFIPRIKRTHIHDGVESYLPFVYEQITEFELEYFRRGVEFPSIVGLSDCVETDDQDIVFYAIREGRHGFTRFVINRESLPTKWITIVLRKLSSYYQIITCYFGEPAPCEPGDSYATEDSLEFWLSHALVFGNEAIIEGSRTYDNPWVLNQAAICNVWDNKH
jgi:cold shock CspA family protein